MERLTRGVMIFEDSEKQMLYNRLRYYEDLQEGGRLSGLAVGDTVWTNVVMANRRFREKGRPYKAVVTFIGISIDRRENFMKAELDKGGTTYVLEFNFSDIGTRVFTARGEAEKALEGKAE